IIMILLMVPLGRLSLGGISEKYLPSSNSVRQAQEEFDRIFPGFRTEPVTLVIQSSNHKPLTDDQVALIRSKAMAIPGFIVPGNNPANMWKERPYLDGASKDPSVRVIQSGLVNRNEAAAKIDALRSISAQRGEIVWVGGTPALEHDSIQSIFSKLPLMAVILLGTTILLMFLAFGSLVLPIKAALMSVLTLGSTLGVLTWIFVDGHFSGWLNFTPTPLTAPVIGLIVAVIFGLSTDYEVFLVSRMVEARALGMPTTEAVRIGTATTGRLITAAALVLAVVAGTFVMSDLVMMKYLAFGLITALVLDATVVRMFLVPSVMKLLGDECWWAPRSLKRLHTWLGLGEIGLRDERIPPAVPEPDPESEEVLVGAGAPVRPRPPHDPTRPAVEGSARAEAAAGGASTPSTATTMPMPDVGGALAGQPPVAEISNANDPENSADGEVSAQRTDGTESPAAQGEDGEIESWLSALRPPRTSDSSSVGSTNGDDPDATPAIPTRLQKDPDTT
ncbi:MAG: trehalose monomycolate/heme transporter, partial [Mycobacterium sp.]|nr:trehalose monomycolate/heme transporter [Mycobacterium sp.]